MMFEIGKVLRTRLQRAPTMASRRHLQDGHHDDDNSQQGAGEPDCSHAVPHPPPPIIVPETHDQFRHLDISLRSIVATCFR